MFSQAVIDPSFDLFDDFEAFSSIDFVGNEPQHPSERGGHTGEENMFAASSLPAMAGFSQPSRVQKIYFLLIHTIKKQISS